MTDAVAEVNAVRSQAQQLLASFAQECTASVESVAAELSSLELVLETQDTGKKKKKKGEDPKVLVPWRTS